jgi:hypothetical protein
LRIHTTIDNPACITQVPISGGLVLTDPSNAREDGSAQLDNQFICVQHSRLAPGCRHGIDF